MHMAATMVTSNFQHYQILIKLQKTRVDVIAVSIQLIEGEQK